jgi:hypothetical protein
VKYNYMFMYLLRETKVSIGLVKAFLYVAKPLFLATSHCCFHMWLANNIHLPSTVIRLRSHW